MKQKSFITPVWVMAITGLLDVWSFLFILHSFSASLPGFKFGGMSMILGFLWPALFFSEAYLYWVIRKRVTRRNLAKAHVYLTFFAAVILRWIMYVRIIMHAGIFSIEFTAILYDLSLIVGHAFFITIISEAWMKKRAPLDDDDKNIHLLDDIVEP